MFRVLPAEQGLKYLTLIMAAALGISACGGGGTTGGLNNTNLTGNPTTANPTATKAPGLPLTFDDATVNYNTSSVAGGSATVANDPAGGTDHSKVLQVTITGQSTYDGIVLNSTGNGLASAIAFSGTVSQLKADVYAPAAGVPILLKAETLDGKSCTATLASTTQAKAWENLTFEFKNSIDAGTGCTAPDTSKQYVRLVILPYYGTKVSSAQNYYFDNVALGGTTNLVAATLPVSFDTTGVNYGTTGIAAGSASLIQDPASGGSRGNVLKIVTGGTGATTYDGVTLTSLGAGLGTPVGFTNSIKTMTLDVYSPRSGVPFLLKAETSDGTSCTAALASTTKVNTWETLTFDFTNATAGGCTAVDSTKAYVKVSIFPNFGTQDSAGSTYHVDNIALGVAPPTPPASPGSTGNCTSTSSVKCYTFSEAGFKAAPFSDLTAVVGNDPIVVSPVNNVLQVVTTAASNGWGGATLDPGGAGANTIAPVILGSSKVVTLRVYAAKAGIPILLKFESSANAGDNFQLAAKTTVANQWETLSFDFTSIGTGNSPGAFPFSNGSYDSSKTYDRVSVFPDFATSDPKPNGAQTYYFDELTFPTGTPPAASPFPIASGSGTALAAGKYASDYLASGTGESGAYGFYADGANTVQWWSGYASLAAPTTDPNMYFGYGAKAATTYIGGFVKAPANGTAKMVGYTRFQVGIWGNNELMSTKPTFKVILKGAPIAGGCQPEVSADVVNTAGNGVVYYTVLFSSLSMRQDCGSFASVAAVLAGGINELHVQLLPPNMQFTTGNDGSGNFPNGLNIGTITFLP